jgi:hypothetical protein
MIPTIGRWAEAPDLIEPIVGYRAWRYTLSEGVHLLPFNGAAALWPKSEWDDAWEAWVTSSCRVPRVVTHLAPDEDCTCGFYAVKSREDVGAYTPGLIYQLGGTREDGGDGAVFGRVLLAGKVIEHATGYRAERARITELIPTTTDAGTTLALASRLGIPLGPTLDTAPLLLGMEEFFGLSPTEQPSRPGLLDHWRLKRHARHFRLIQGTRDD